MYSFNVQKSMLLNSGYSVAEFEQIIFVPRYII